MRSKLCLIFLCVLIIFFLVPLCFSSPLFLVSAIFLVIYFVLKNKEYKASAYYQVTKLPYLSVRFDVGRYGEYLTYKYLKRFEECGAKFLFNIYVPKKTAGTTEIDVLMISPKGLFVFESKNFSGWIFGNERQKNWCQTLPAGRGRSHKEYFYNPIWQNRGHINHLKSIVGKQVLLHSVVVFSDRCTLRDIQIESNDVSVINRYKVDSVVSSVYQSIPLNLLNADEIERIYNKLFPYTQVSNTAKKQHIDDIHNCRSL